MMREMALNYGKVTLPIGIGRVHPNITKATGQPRAARSYAETLERNRAIQWRPAPDSPVEVVIEGSEAVLRGRR